LAGEVLKKRREELGLSIGEVSELLRIKAEYLSSIEADQFEKLPVAVYTIGYIRSYAAYLRIDPEPILSFYAGHLSHPGHTTIIPVASSKKKIPFSYYIIPLLVLLMIPLVVIVVRQGASLPQPKMPPSPVQPAPAESPKQAAPLQEPLQPPTTMQQPQANAQVPAKTNAGAGHRLDVMADDLTWVLITFSDGKTEEALLRPGSAKTWTFPETALLKLGNAGGVRLKLDGEDIGSPGSSGQVMTIAFPENRQITPQDGTLEQR
jgi:cytoskeletal protein RodZ